MTVRVYDYQLFSGSVSPSSLNSEVIVVEITGDGEHPFMVEGWFDLSPLQSGDTVVLTEYVSVDGSGYGVYLSSEFSGAQEMPVIHFHMRSFLPDQKYKLTINQTAGTLRSFPFRFIAEFMEKT